MTVENWDIFNQVSPVHVVQGEYKVSDDPNLYFSTVLGSCVAVCLYDDVARLGGMNHILLPGEQSDQGSHARYGVHLMELLINGVLRSGGQKSRLRAKVFGGARISKANVEIGAKNAAFVRTFLSVEGIACTSESLGGRQARKVQFVPSSGMARQMLIDAPKTLEIEEAPRRAVQRPASDEITLF
jgi:chemotaxis protein CheD